MTLGSIAHWLSMDSGRDRRRGDHASRGKLFLAQQKSTCIAKYLAIAKTILEASKFTSEQIGIRRTIPTSPVANREDLTSAKNLSIIDILRGCTVRRVNPSFAVTRIIYPASMRSLSRLRLQHLSTVYTVFESMACTLAPLCLPRHLILRGHSDSMTM